MFCDKKSSTFNTHPRPILMGDTHQPAITHWTFNNPLLKKQSQIQQIQALKALWVEGISCIII